MSGEQSCQVWRVMRWGASKSYDHPVHSVRTPRKQEPPEPATSSLPRSPIPPSTVRRAHVAPRPAVVRGDPPPLRGGPLAFLRFARAHHMVSRGYLVLIIRWMWLKLRWRGRLVTDGLCFVCPGVKFEIGR
ncbi:MAG: hypothetical protein ACLPZR_08575, partial [Solirubrobacteraceae bacterium]